MKTTKYFLLSLLVVGMTFLSACRPAQPKKDPATVYTQAAQTVAAQLTKDGPRGTVTTQSAPATQTPPPAITPPTAAPTTANAGTLPGSVKPTVSLPTTNVDDKAQYLTQNPADGNQVPVGSKFKMTWTVKNIGKTTWTTQYLLRFFAGDPLGGPAAVNLPKEVKPEEQVDITVDLTAPNSPGTYNSIWVITNKDGVNFQAVTIEIKAANAPTATPTLTPTPTSTGIPADPAGTQAAATATCQADPSACTEP